MVREPGGEKGLPTNEKIPLSSPHHLRSGSLAGGPLLFPGRPVTLEVS